ncbi:MAG: translocation/assembly module TamB domain-containing protein, partial [Chlorobi bacterium]|nr:translocation/assembly module TamB domain-containing protein [Chlorobiota bacterium]
IERLPINLAFIDIKNRLRNDKAKFSLKARDLPLNIAGSFVPGISKLRGRVDATLNLNGYLPDDFDFDGSVTVKNAKFLSESNNMYYGTNARISLNSDKITVEELTIRNSKLDLKRGKAVISGFVTLDEKMKPDEINFNLQSKGIKVLSRASEKSMPALFGDFVIATGDNPMKIYGKTDALNIRGDLNVINANIYMPDIDKTSISKSVFKYEIVGDEHQFSSVIVEDSTSDIPEKIRRKKRKTNIDDLLDIAVNLRIPGRMYLTIDMISIGRLKIEVGLTDRSQPLGYYKKRGSSVPIITGSGLLVKEGSSLNFIKSFKTTGSVFFPTGSITDPGIDLTAVHQGQSIVKEKPRDYSVKMFITGTKNKPLINFGYAINGVEAIGDSSQIRQDAIFLLISGKTKADFEV